MTQSLEERFGAAYDEYADAIFRFCYAQTRRRELALDLMQDAFARTWSHLVGGNIIRELRPFLYKAARNALIDHHRRAHPASLDALHEGGFDAVDDEAPDPHLSATAAHAIRVASSLEPPYREALLMRFVDDLKPREIADITGDSENVISVRITRGLQKLRELLKP